MTQVLYWPLVDATGPVELLAHRVIWCAVACLLAVLAASRRRQGLRAILRQPRRLGLSAAAGGCLSVAWGIYIYAVNSGQVVEGSLGLFMVPLATVLAAVAVFGERLRVAQWGALGAAVMATGVLTVGYGRLPWIALTLSALMAVYATLKKKAAAPTLEGFTLECLTVAPLALGCLAILAATGRDTAVSISATHALLIVASGLVTAVPLLCHAASLHRLPLSVVGVLQYLNPTGQFLMGVLIRHEDMPASRWLGFGLVWSAVVAVVITSYPGPGRTAERQRAQL